MRQEDYDGVFEYSPVVRVDRRDVGSPYLIYPNPTTVGVAWQGFVGSVLNVTVFSLSGNQVCAASGTTEEVQVQISQCLQYQVNGKYIMQFQSPTDRYQTLLIKG